MYIYMVVYKVLSMKFRLLSSKREVQIVYIGSCQVFENLRFLRKVSDFSTIFFGWVLHRGDQGPGKGPNIW